MDVTAYSERQDQVVGLSFPIIPELDEREQGVSVVVPAFNEEDAVAETLDEVHSHLKRSGWNYEVIVVNDGSQDGTRGILESRRDVRVITHERNRGYGAALKTGCRFAKYPLIVIADADGTYPIDRIPDLVALAEKADMVVGARTGRDVRHPLPRWLLRQILVRFAEWVARCRIPDLNSGLRVFRKGTVERFLNILPDSFSFTTTITLAMLASGYIVHYEPIAYHPRVGRSKIRAGDVVRFAQLILRTGVYFAPLRMFLPPAAVLFAGFLFTLLQDIFVREDLTERTLILLISSAQIGLFALLADMIHKRTR